MGSFTIGEAWSRAIDFINRNLQMLVILVGGAVAAFGIVQLILIGGNPDAFAQQIAAAIQTGNIEALSQAAGGAGLGLVGFFALLVQSATQFAACRIGLGHGDSIGEALTYGFKAAILFLLLMLAIGIGIGGILAVLLITMGAGLFAAGAGVGSIGIIALIGLLLVIVMLWLFARLSVVTPVMADAGSVNPLFGISQSWRLTGPNQWSIVGYLLLLVIALLVISTVVGGLVGLFGGFVGGIATLLLVDVPVAIVSLAVVVGIYLALNPRNAGDVFA